MKTIARMNISPMMKPWHGLVLAAALAFSMPATADANSVFRQFLPFVPTTLVATETGSKPAPARN